jgi:hypothetical protein
MPKGDQNAMMGNGLMMSNIGAEGGMPMCGMMGGGMMSGQIDAHLSKVRSDLAITPAQMGAWNAFADAMRSMAANMAQSRQQMMGAWGAGAHLSPIDRLDQHDRMLGAMRDGLRALRPALVQLYAALTPEQKLKADTALVPQCPLTAPMRKGATQEK